MLSPQAPFTDQGLRHTDYTRIYKEHKGSSSFLPLYTF